MCEKILIGIKKCEQNIFYKTPKIWRKFYSCEKIYKSKIPYKKLGKNVIFARNFRVKNWEKISNFLFENWKWTRIFFDYVNLDQ